MYAQHCRQMHGRNVISYPWQGQISETITMLFIFELPVEASFSRTYRIRIEPLHLTTTKDRLYFWQGNRKIRLHTYRSIANRIHVHILVFGKLNQASSIFTPKAEIFHHLTHVVTATVFFNTRSTLGTFLRI
jgi:hypothetical protein